MILKTIEINHTFIWNKIDISIWNNMIFVRKEYNSKENSHEYHIET